jgi:hypothetical protein
MQPQSGLPRAIERRLLRRYARTPTGRITASAALRALGVLVRHHPGTALEMAGAGLVQAGRTGVQELTARVRSLERDDAAPEAAPEATPEPRERPEPALSRGDLRRIRKRLRQEAKRRAARAEA